MTNEMELENEKLKDEQLDQVAGGTVSQCQEIHLAVLNNPELKKVLESMPTFSNTLGGKTGIDRALEGVLKTMGIDASLNRTNGTMYDNFENQYVDSSTGKTLSHSEVLKMISSVKGC